MAKYNVVYTQYYSYTVEADCEDEAESLAYDMFETDMRCPIANTFYDDIEIECVEDDEEY
jgi:hypothetical protein